MGTLAAHISHVAMVLEADNVMQKYRYTRENGNWAGTVVRGPNCTNVTETVAVNSA